MKFNRLSVAPRPLETFHFADEKQPRITFTKYAGILRSRGGGLIPPSRNVEYNFMPRFFLKKDRDNPRRQTKTGGPREQGGKEEEQGEGRSKKQRG